MWMRHDRAGEGGVWVLGCEGAGVHGCGDGGKGGWVVWCNNNNNPHVSNDARHTHTHTHIHPRNQVYNATPCTCMACVCERWVAGGVWVAIGCVRRRGVGACAGERVEWVVRDGVGSVSVDEARPGG